MAEGSWFCVVCGEIIAKDVKRLKELQRKIRFEQERVKKEMPEISDKIEPDEFIYWCYYYKGLLANKYFIVTDKKLIKYDNFGQYWEAPWSEVVTIGDLEFIRLGSGYRNQFVVRTFNETVTFEFGEDSCLKFNANAQRALNDYTLQKKDIMALIYSLKFKDEEQQKP